jgi:hypothetical protein
MVHACEEREPWSLEMGAMDLYAAERGLRCCALARVIAGLDRGLARTEKQLLTK